MVVTPELVDPTTTYPTITIDGEPVELRLSCLSVVKLLERGIEVGAVRTTPQTPGAAIRETFEILAEAVSHKMKRTADELMGLFSFGEFGEVAAAVSDAVLKASAQINQTTAKRKRTLAKVDAA